METTTISHFVQQAHTFRSCECESVTVCVRKEWVSKVWFSLRCHAFLLALADAATWRIVDFFLSLDPVQRFIAYE